MRLIDADAYKQALQAHHSTIEQDCTCNETYREGCKAGLEAAMFEIGCAPDINAAQVTYAHWENERDHERQWYCSNCGTRQGIAYVLMNYCPRCGAKMAENPEAASGVGQAFSPD